MTMKNHILAALSEQALLWEELLLNLSETQITAPRFDHGWSIQDMVAHLWAWQQSSIARLEAGVKDHEPDFPDWLTGMTADWEDNVDRTNSSIYEACHARPWQTMHQEWRDGYLKLITLGKELPERDMLNGDRYPWLKGYSLAYVLIASYDHHQEHLEKVTAVLRKSAGATAESTD